MKSLLILVSLLIITLPAIAQSQGIKGKVEWLSGNQMPGPGINAAKPEGIQRELWIYEAVSVSGAKADGVFFSEIQTPLVKKIKTKANGKFRVRLTPGDYSVFVREKIGLFANRFDAQNRISCVVVKRGKFERITIRVDYEAAY